MATKRGTAPEEKRAPGERWNRGDADDQPAAAYVRVSADGPPREIQEEVIRQYAQESGIEISASFVEVAEIAEGDIVDRRMALFELLGAAQAGKIKKVVAAKWEAIASAPAEAAMIALMMERSGADLIFADGFDAGPYREAANRLIEARH